jgi:hypothetical protein
MQQPVIQLRTAIHGKSFSGGALNRVQKPLHVRSFLSVQRLRLLVYLTDSSKPGRAGLCNSGHTGISRSNLESTAAGLPFLIRAVQGT